GVANLAGDVQMAGAGTLKFTGTAGLNKLALHGAGDKAPVLRLGQFSLQGIALDLAKRQVSAQQARIADVATDVRRRADGALDLQSLLVPQPAAKAAAPSKPAAAPWTARIARVELSGGTLGLADAGSGVSL